LWGETWQRPVTSDPAIIRIGRMQENQGKRNVDPASVWAQAQFVNYRITLIEAVLRSVKTFFEGDSILLE